LDDEALVSRARAGDLSAAERLFSRHQNGAYTAALRLLAVPADAEDVAQDVLVRAFTHMAELGEGASFGAWLRRIAVNLSLNVLRRRGLLQFEPLEGGGEKGAPGDARDFADERAMSPEDSVINIALRDELDLLVRRLPAEQRVAVVLRDIYGYDVAEVAELQRCGLSAAKMRIARGREQLRRLVIEAGIRLGASAT